MFFKGIVFRKLKVFSKGTGELRLDVRIIKISRALFISGREGFMRGL